MTDIRPGCCALRTPCVPMARRLFLAASLVAAFTPCSPAGTPRLEAQVSWIGNSHPGADRWVPQDVATLCVLPDGTLFTNVEWEEGGGQVMALRDGQPVARAGHTHGWGYTGGRAIAANEKYLFIAQSVHNEGGNLRDPDTWPTKGKTWFGISRRLRSDITKAAPFDGGKGGKGDTLARSFLPIHEVPDGTDAHLAGLAATATELFVSDPHAGRICVYDAETMMPLRDWPLDRPGPLALHRGQLWCLQSVEKGKPTMLWSTSKESTVGISIAPPVEPVALATDSRGRFYLADAGPAQNILILTPNLGHYDFSSLGITGGLFAGPVPGRFGDLRFNRPRAVAVDAQDRVYVASDGSTGGGGTVLECYNPDRSLAWRQLGLLFVDLADLDAASGRDLFTKEEHFRFDPSAPPGQQAQYVGYTVDPFRYPEDPRLHIWSAGAWVRTIEGRRLLFVTDMSNEHLQVYRFAPESDGEIAIPSALFAKRRVRPEKPEDWPPHQPDRGAWIWRDASGDGRFDPVEFDCAPETADLPAAQGWYVDTAGTVWLATETAGIRRFPFQGFDARGNPSWTFATSSTAPHPAALDRVKRLRYDPATDTMFLGGTTREHANQHWKPMGPALARYDAWSRGPSDPRWLTVAPYVKGSSGHTSCEPMGFDLAGDYLFLPYTGASKEAGFSTGHIEILRAADGQPVGHLEPSPEIGEIGLQDIRESLNAHRLPHSSYLLFVEDDSKAKTVLFRWRPTAAQEARP